MKLDIATPEKSLPTLDVEEVVVPTVAGEAMILPGHARLVSQLVEGTLSYRSPAETKRFAVKGGVVEVRDDHILVLCDQADLSPT
jgi:F-type H+-transporting ATPase subunit epsilon